MNAISSEIIDFHSHFVDRRWTLTTTAGLTSERRRQWDEINRRIVDEAELLSAVESGDLTARVVNTPTAFIADADGNVPADTYRRINDQLADLIARHPGRLFALATVDTFGGDAAAGELVRAVSELGLSGVFLESARGDLLLDAPQARPVLTAAARLDVPVFVHPVNPQPLTTQLAPYGRLGTLLARGTINAAALVALIEGGTLDELPELKLVFTALAIGGILLSSGFGDHSAVERDVKAVLRRNVYVDTMGFDPALIRSAVDVLGEDHVIAGSDWPIVNAGPIAERAETALKAAGLSEAARRKVRSENARRILGVQGGG